MFIPVIGIVLILGFLILWVLSTNESAKRKELFNAVMLNVRDYDGAKLDRENLLMCRSTSQLAQLLPPFITIIREMRSLEQQLAAAERKGDYPHEAKLRWLELKQARLPILKATLEA